MVSGAPLGTVIAMPITGLISNSNSLGWPVAYYLFGAFGIAWSIIWMVVGSDCPSKNKFISISEKRYITCGLKSEEEELKHVCIMSTKNKLIIKAFSESTNTVDCNSHICAILGYRHKWLWRKLGVLDITYQNPIVHAKYSEFRYCIGKTLECFYYSLLCTVLKWILL